MSDGPIKTRAIKRSTLIAILVFAAFGVLLLRILLIRLKAKKMILLTVPLQQVS